MRWAVIVALWLGAGAVHAQDKAEGIEGLSRERGHQDVRTLLEHGIRDLTYLAMRPWDLFLQPLPDGKYHYRGTGFDAVILEDGSIEFRDRGPVQLRLAQILDQRMLPKNRPTVALSFGPLSELIAKLAKNDPHAAERRRFFEKTRTLREQLHEQHQQRILDRAHAELSRELTRIANEADRTGAERAQDALFALWDRCSDDGVGDEARRYIEHFVRAYCGPGEPCAFDANALARLNGARKSKREFAPYAAK